MRWLYTLGIRLYTLGIRVAALIGHSKAQQMLAGWRDADLTASQLGNEGTVWFHAASLGEFEQARPVMERYKQLHPESRLVLTFFSPSGYEVRHDYPIAEAVLYLPPDVPRRVRRLIDAIHPEKAFFVKYDIWYNYLDYLHRCGVPTYLFSAIFRPKQYFFQPWGRWFRHRLSEGYSHIFVQNEASLRLLQRHGIEHCSMAGDTRFDRVSQIAAATVRNSAIERFLEGSKGTMVCGSTWPPDERLIASLRNKNEDWFPDKIVIAPHVVAEEHLRQIEHLFPDSIRYSEWTTQNKPNEMRVRHVLIIDSIGFLSQIYRYAYVAYIGGGFGVGIHNILEAVTYGTPVFFGPNYHKFQEAEDIVSIGGGWAVNDVEEMHQGAFRSLMTNVDARQRASVACLNYMQQHVGCTDKIFSTIEK